MTIPKQQRTKADLVYEALQSSIMSGNIREGEHLRQEEVAARLGVSQTPVREAFRRLESEGLVEHAPNRGIIVRGIPWSPPPSPLDVIARRWGELVLTSACQAFASAALKRVLARIRPWGTPFSSEVQSWIRVLCCNPKSALALK